MTYFIENQVECQVPKTVDPPDKHFHWFGRKMETFRLASLYEMAGKHRYAERAAGCSSYLKFLGSGQERSLDWANFCQLRLCPLCTARRARSAANRLSRVMDAVQAETGCQYIFLTLTMENVDGAHLKEALTELTAAWHKLMRQRPVKAAVKGWFRALEVTRGDGIKKADNGYHPHLHAVLAVEDAYFNKKSGLYLTKDEWIRRWQMALKVPYRPSVKISRTNGRKDGKGAVLEAAKYVVKSVEYISPRLSDERAIEVLTDYTDALHHRRLTGLGGWLKDMAARLQVGDLDEADLVHIDDDYIRADLADMVEVYRWNFGAGGYVLAERWANSVQVVRDDDQGKTF